MNKGIFISGTGFQTGKTFIAAGLAANLYKMGINIGVIKPIVHECLKCSGKPYSIQGEMLKLAAGTMDDPDLIYPYCLRNRDFTQLLFKDDNEIFSIEYLMERYKKMQSQYEYVIVVGIGGIAEQITPNLNTVDIVEKLGLPIIFVTNDNLDTYNHLQLTIKYSKYKNMDIRGFIINQKEEEILDEKTDRRINLLKEQIDIPYLGFNPFAEGVNPVYDELGLLVENFRQAINIKKLL